MPVPEQIAGGRRRHDQRQGPERAIEAGNARQQQVAERHGDGLAPRQPVDAVHEVEEIDEPQPGKAREQALHRNGKDGEHAGLRRQRGEAQRHRHGLGREADGGREPAAIVDPRQGAESGKARQQQQMRPAQRALPQRPQDERGGDDGNAAADRHGHPVHAALVGELHAARRRHRPRIEPDQRPAQRCGDDGEERGGKEGVHAGGRVSRVFAGCQRVAVA